MTTATEVNEVPPYVSVEEEDMNDNVQVERKRTNKKQHKWMKEMVFNNAGKAKQAVINEGVWSEYYTNTAVDGKKRFLDATKLNVVENNVMPIFIYCLVRLTKKQGGNSKTSDFKFTQNSKDFMRLQGTSMDLKWFPKIFLDFSTLM
jgi:hypothetical protein